ncbi:MAG TPA: hypothetical protein VMZ92_19630 [Planctomycetota bacterium]|nr:hypothetical protein [Planctomycetota bacterium]
MAVMRGAFTVIGRHRRAYVVLNVVFYGLVVCGMVVAAVNPALQQSLIESVRSSLAKGPLAPLARAYKEGNVLTAMLLTFLVNLAGGAFLSITVP